MTCRCGLRHPCPMSRVGASLRSSPSHQEQEEEAAKPAPAAETAQYDRGKSMRSEDPNFQQKQEERCESYVCRTAAGPWR